MKSKEYLTIRQAGSEHLPGRPHINTVRRWMFDGVKGDGVKRVKLRSVLIGGKRFTTEQWCDEFIAAISSLSSQLDQHCEAEAKLDVLGV